MRSGISIWLELGKVKITIAVSITTATGYFLYDARPGTGLLMTVLGIFLLASGASALNHLQEYRYDGRMDRTKNRPLPSGRISVAGVIAISMAYSLGGSALLLAGGGLTCLLLGLLAFFWYNVVYTYLKRSTPWAVIPGSLIGSIPPVIGWVCAGGSLSDTELLPVAAFFFIWQVPHFWLLIMKYGREYESAGFPSLSGNMSQEKLGRMIYIWILLTALVTLGFTLAGPLMSIMAKVGLWIASAWLIISFSPLLKKSRSGIQPGKYFMRINSFVLLAVVFMCLDKLVLNNLENLL